jgi:hypothetical protein
VLEKLAKESLKSRIAGPFKKKSQKFGMFSFGFGA